MRSAHSDLAVLVLSQQVEASGAVALDCAGAGVGCEFVDAAREVVGGRPVIDATVARRKMARRPAESLVVSAKIIETHVSSILIKLDLPMPPKATTAYKPCCDSSKPIRQRRQAGIKLGRGASSKVGV